MLLPSLALFGRAFRVESRQLRAHLFRAVFVGLIFLALVVAYFQSLVFGAPGLQLFYWIIWQTTLFLCLGTVGFFATAISEEKEEATLGLLRMAGIGPLALLLGKSTTRLISAILILAVQFPFTLLAITLGGVTLHQVVSAYVALLAFLIFVANLGLFCSVVASTSGRASAASTILLLLFLLFPSLPIFFSPTAGPSSTLEWVWVHFVRIVSAAADWMNDTSLFSRLNTILSTGFNEPVLHAQVWSHILYAVALFLLSWALFDRCTRSAGTADADAVSPFVGEIVQRRRSRRAWSRPLVWKEFYFLAGGTTMLVVKFVLFGLVALFIAMVGTSGKWEEIGSVIMVVMLVLLGIELSIHASRLFSQEVHGQTWAILTLLPISTPKICLAKTAGALLGTPPIAIWFLIGAALAPATFGEALINGFVLYPYGWYALLQFVVFLHVVALMSLVVKWGALPLSIGVMYIVHTCVSPILIFPLALNAWSGAATLAVIPIVLANAGVIFIIQVLIHERLQQLAIR